MAAVLYLRLFNLGFDDFHESQKASNAGNWRVARNMLNNFFRRNIQFHGQKQGLPQWNVKKQRKSNLA